MLCRPRRTLYTHRPVQSKACLAGHTIASWVVPRANSVSGPRPIVSLSDTCLAIDQALRTCIMRVTGVVHNVA